MAQVPPGGWDFRFADPERDLIRRHAAKAEFPADPPRARLWPAVRIAGNGGIEAERRMGGMEPKLMRAACERQKVDQRTSVFFTQPPPDRARPRARPERQSAAAGRADVW